MRNQSGMRAPTEPPPPEIAFPPKKGGITRRVLLGGLGVGAFAGVAGEATGGYSYLEASHGLVVTPYRIVSPRWTAGRRLTITVIADLHAGGPNMTVERIRDVVDTANALRSDLVVLLGDYFATHRFVDPVVP